MTKPKTYSEIVDDIVDYYKTNLRGEKDGKCIYTGCAVGYACGFQVDEWDEHGDFWDVMESVGEDSVWEKFLPEYCKTNAGFWSDVQKLHDHSLNWVGNALGGQDLSEAGKERVNSIKKYYKESY
jgi:hypothetical protein